MLENTAGSSEHFDCSLVVPKLAGANEHFWRSTMPAL